MLMLAARLGQPPLPLLPLPVAPLVLVPLPLLLALLARQEQVLRVAVLRAQRRALRAASSTRRAPRRPVRLRLGRRPRMHLVRRAP